MLGQFDELKAVVGDIAQQIVNAALPKVQELVKAGMTSAEPTIRKIVQEEVVPKAAFFGVGGMIAVGAVAALIGSLFATARRRSEARRS